MPYSISTLLKKFLKLSAFSLVFMSFLISAKEQGHGRVTINGEIIDSACSLDMDNSDQTVDMLTQPISEVISETEGLPNEITIGLKNCSFNKASQTNQNEDEWKYFRITFEGDREDKFFGVSGDATGVALEIYDPDGNIALPGEPMPKASIPLGSKGLKYFIKLVGNGKTLEPGAYYTTIRYKLDYY
jgi:type 1 fimbria pilin